MGKRERLDKLLVDRGLVISREQGRGKIMAGEVLVDNQPVTKAGFLVDVGATIRLKSDAIPYVSRGGLKLAKALQEFQIDVNGKTVIDAGASSGGFTDCLLAHGALQVYAVDVGYGQLDWKLRNDPRVIVFEKTNVRYLTAADLPQAADVATLDLSFISLRLVLLPIKGLLVPGGAVVALIKPQFEVGKGKVGKGGVVRSSDEHRRVIGEISDAAIALSFAVCGVTESPLLGPKGNKEFFIHLRTPPMAS